MPNRSYVGTRDGDGNAIVRVHYENGVKAALASRLDLRSHSPDGFEWGYGGSGPAQLSLAILADALGDDAEAVRLYQFFKWNEIGFFERDEPWTIKRESILVWVKTQKAK